MRKVSPGPKVHRFNFHRATSLLLCFALLILSGCAQREIENRDSRGKGIICFGDSITFGYGVAPGQDYPTQLAKLVDISVVNAGVDGDTTVDALKRIHRDVLEKNPFLVIIEFGGNDFLKKVAKEDTLKNLKEMIRLVHAHGAMVALVDISAGMFFAEYRGLYQKLAKEMQCIFIPHILDGIITNPSMKSDFLHPNVEGYKIVAQRIYQAVSPYLKPDTL